MGGSVERPPVRRRRQRPTLRRSFDDSLWAKMGTTHFYGEAGEDKRQRRTRWRPDLRRRRRGLRRLHRPREPADHLARLARPVTAKAGERDYIVSRRRDRRRWQRHDLISALPERTLSDGGGGDDTLQGWGGNDTLYGETATIRCSPGMATTRSTAAWAAIISRAARGTTRSTRQRRQRPRLPLRRARPRRGTD
jgi:Ca2+-binding RTX toxin-like protein